MKRLTPHRNFFWALLIPLLLVACDNDEEELFRAEVPTMNIIESAQSEENLSDLTAAMARVDTDTESDLVDDLSSSGPFTVFAPTNEAFGALLTEIGVSSIDDLDSEEELELLETILSYHVVAGVAAEAADLSDGQVLETAQGESLTIGTEDGVTVQDATDTPANVVLPDLRTINGIVHVIDKVLLPQSVIDAMKEETMAGDSNTLVDLVVEIEALSILEAAVIKADLAGALSGEGPFTVFAPTDDAFVALLDILGDDYNSLDDFDTEAEITLLRNVLLYHVVEGDIREADLAEGVVPTLFAGNDLEIEEENDAFVIEDETEIFANITGTDFVASNGVAHTIDKVLLPEAVLDFLEGEEPDLKTIVELAIETDDLSILVDALVAANAGLVETLGEEGPFTVFAPTNQAFVDLLGVLGDDYNSLSDFDTDAEIDLLIDILTYHVVAGTAAFSTDLEDGQQIQTVFGEKVGIDIKGGVVHIEDASETNATVVIPDVKASNGVVHVIDKVLLPQAALDFVASLQLKTIVELAIETDDLSILVDALVAANAGLVETLGEEGPFTVFAPTNQAFVDLLGVLGDDYNSLSDFDTDAEIDLLIDILTYHVVAGTAAFSTDLEDGQQIQTVFGEKVGIDIKGGVVHIEDASETNATVVIPDVKASNGVVHVIDKVLLPQAALDALNPPLPNIVELAQATPELESLVTALITAEAGFVEFLSGEGPFTVFAPTNEAFEELLDALGDEFHSLADFDTPAEKALLAEVLTYHLAEGEALFSTDLTDHQPIYTVQGEKLFAILSHGVAIRDKTDIDANVQAPDNAASNGVVHIIDKILLPQAVLDALAAPAH